MLIHYLLVHEGAGRTCANIAKIGLHRKPLSQTTPSIKDHRIIEFFFLKTLSSSLGRNVM